jgi:hypothetical protein
MKRKVPKKPKPPSQWRLVRFYKRIAQKNHGHCKVCGRLIREKDVYTCEIWIVDEKFFTRKEHSRCSKSKKDNFFRWLEGREEMCVLLVAVAAKR